MENELNNEIDNILVERLLEYYEMPNWDGISISLKDIKEGIKNQLLEITEKYPEYPIQKRLTEMKNKEWHIGRIIYFINNPEKITPIDIDNLCDAGNIYPIPIITEGNHRFLASIIRNDKYISAYYSGLVNLLKYLKGETNNKPA